MHSAATSQRERLRLAGYSPIPVEGKRPAPKAWQEKLTTNFAEIQLWESVYQFADNTGILTRLTPTIDIDITDTEAAEAVEGLARERFEERGYVLVRIGKAPKRAIPLRTDAPFPKITRNLIAPNGSEHKIELLCDGQQVVCFGNHPETRLPYTWHGGEPGTIRHEDLPHVSAETATQFVDAAVALLVQQFGFKLAGNRPEQGKLPDGDGQTDWQWLIGNINAGRELHDSTAVLASKMIASGMGEGAAVNALRGMYQASTVARDERWQQRYAEIPRAVASANRKFGAGISAPAETPQTAQASVVVVPTQYLMPDAAAIPPREWLSFKHYMRGVVTSTVAPGGFGKTTLALYEALEMVKLGLRVWYVSAEDDRKELDRRIAGYIKRHGIVQAEMEQRLFVDDKLSFPFKIARALRGVVTFDEAKLDAFELAVAHHRIDVVLLDPFISFHYLPENDTASMDGLVKRLGDICARNSMCIELPHHVRKRPSNQIDITVDDARGAGAIVNAVRSCRVLNVMSVVEAQQAEIRAEQRMFYLRLDSGKTNMAPPDKARWLHLCSVEIANGDHIGVIEPWAFPSVFGKLSTADVAWVQELVRVQAYRADRRSPDWLGHQLAQRFGRSVSELGDIKWINAVLATWVRNKVIGKRKLPDNEHKPRVFYVPAGGESGQTPNEVSEEEEEDE